MPTYKTYEEMGVWQESRKLVQAVRSICKRPEAKRDFAFVDQITRAVRSVSANIAEGFEAMTVPEFIAYLGIAKRSAGETRAHLHDALDEQYISSEEFKTLADQTKTVSRELAGFIHYLQSVDQKRKRTMKNQK